jgi:hypothetical protein
MALSLNVFENGSYRMTLNWKCLDMEVIVWPWILRFLKALAMKVINLEYGKLEMIEQFGIYRCLNDLEYRGAWPISNMEFKFFLLRNLLMFINHGIQVNNYSLEFIL